MKNNLLTVLGFYLLFAFQVTKAQSNDTLAVNQLGALINADGSLFQGEFPDYYSLRFPVNNPISHNLVYAGGYWLAADNTSVGGNLHVAATMFAEQGENDFSHGPVADVYDSAYDSRYNRVWTVTQEQINQHIVLYQTSGYVMPEVIATWPAHGNTDNNEPAYLAPFIDVNNDGWYQPQLGDYPAIKGDKAIFYIVNDARFPHASGGAAFNVDMLNMVYAYHVPSDPFLQHSVFLSSRLVNRSSQTYLPVLGMWLDADVGIPSNDVTGCDTLLNVTFAYNRDSIDQTGFDNRPPALGCILLNHSLYTHVHTYNNFNTLGNPSEPEHYYRLLHGLKKDNTPIFYGGNGFTGTVPTRYMYSGNPATGEGWIAIAPGALSGSLDIRTMAVAEPFTFLPGQSICFDWAFTVAQAPLAATLPHLEAVSVLKNYTQQVHNWYNANIQNCPVEPLITGIETTPNRGFIKLYPNPAQNQLLLSVQSDHLQLAQLYVYHANGCMALQQTQNLTQGENIIELWVNRLPAGMYFVEVLMGKHVWRTRLLKKD
ncbi:MAG TPA: T9SS type A sorting domain-containing protein [Chitinophagales bacterium]|nr:T9SS type A sorting domain-containing protein [Chitinophagales bacterium]